MKLADGRVLQNSEEVHLGATLYFWDFLTERQDLAHADLANLLECSVSAEENNLLCMAPFEEEVNEALVSIPK